MQMRLCLVLCCGHCTDQIPIVVTPNSYCRATGTEDGLECNGGSRTEELRACLGLSPAWATSRNAAMATLGQSTTYRRAMEGFVSEQSSVTTFKLLPVEHNLQQCLFKP